MTVIEIFGIICFIVVIILCGIAIKDCRKYLNYTNSFILRASLKIIIFLYILLILLSILFIYTTIIY